MTFADVLAAARENATITERADMVLQSSLVLSNRAGVRIASGCEPRPNGGGGSPVMRWAGAPGGRMVVLDRAVFCELSGYALEVDGASVGVDIDGHGGGAYGYGSQCTLHHMLFHAKRADPNRVMVRIAETSKENQEYHTIRDSNFYAGDGDPCGVGIKNGDGEAKGQKVDGCMLRGFGIAVWQVNGSMNLDGGQGNYYTANEIDIRVDDGNEPSRSLANSEGSRQHLVCRSGMPFTIRAGTRLDPLKTRPGTAYIEAGEILTVESMSFDCRPPAGATLFDLSRCRRFTSSGTIKFAPGTTLAETGLLSMPATADHYMDVIQDNVVDLPPRYIRGGSWRVDRVASNGCDQLIDARVEAMSGIPNFALARCAVTQCGDGVGAGGEYQPFTYTFTKTAGGEPNGNV